MSSTTKLFHPQNQGQLIKYSSNNKIYNSKMSSTSTGHTNSNNSTSPLITKGQQLLLSSNEEDDDEDLSQIQLTTKRPSCSSQLTTNSTLLNSNLMNTNFNTSNRPLTNTNLYNNQPYSQTESQPNYYGQVTMAGTSQLSAANHFLERQTNYRSQSNLGSFSTLNSSKTIEQDHHYYEPMFSNNKIYHQTDQSITNHHLPPLPPERNNFNETNLRSSLNPTNFATLHHPHHNNFLQISNSIQPTHLTNYNTLNLGKHTVISNLTSSSTNLQHLNQFYSKKKLHR